MMMGPRMGPRIPGLPPGLERVMAQRFPGMQFTPEGMQFQLARREAPSPFAPPAPFRQPVPSTGPSMGPQAGPPLIEREGEGGGFFGSIGRFLGNPNNQMGLAALLGAGADIYGAVQQGKIQEAERKRAEEEHRRRRETIDRMAPLFGAWLGNVGQSTPPRQYF